MEPKTARLSDIGRRALDDAHRMAAFGESRPDILTALDLTDDELSFLEALENIVIMRTDPS